MTAVDRVIALALIALALPGLAGAQVLTPTRIQHNSQDSVVFIRAEVVLKNGSVDVWTGTGFIVSSAGFVLTASHVVSAAVDYQKLTITGIPRSRHLALLPLEVVYRDSQVDLALLKFPNIGKEWTPVVFGNSNSVLMSASLFILGFPLDRDLSSATGVLSSTSGVRWQTTAPLNPGNSGGPVFDDHGKVVAIVHSGDRRGEQINFLTPANYARGLLAMAASPVAKPETQAPPEPSQPTDRSTTPKPTRAPAELPAKTAGSYPVEVEYQEWFATARLFNIEIVEGRVLRFNFEIRWRFSPPAPEVFLDSPANTTFLTDQLGRQHQLSEVSGISDTKPITVPVNGSRRFSLSFALAPDLDSFSYHATLLIKRRNYEGRLQIRSKKKISLSDFH